VESSQDSLKDSLPREEAKQERARPSEEISSTALAENLAEKKTKTEPEVVSSKVKDRVEELKPESAKGEMAKDSEPSEPLRQDPLKLEPHKPESKALAQTPLAEPLSYSDLGEEEEESLSPVSPKENLDWQAFATFYLEEEQQKYEGLGVHFAARDFNSLEVEYFPGHLVLKPNLAFQYERLLKIEPYLGESLKKFMGGAEVVLEIKPPQPNKTKTEAELAEQLLLRPEFASLNELLEVEVEHVHQFRNAP
ncbi:MAG: hypothetical protein IJS50_01585, partial [Desulfovibrio sp.]|nr:hypothetical protein [Desulfovibrio sp.]